MPKNRLEYKKLMLEDGTDLFDDENIFKFGYRTLLGKKLKTILFCLNLYPYLMLIL
jgi:hypothetical protein